jgi:hypothetical protein
LYWGMSEPKNKCMKLSRQFRVKKFWPRYLPVTCSFVVRPLLMSTKWNTRRPPMGIMSRTIKAIIDMAVSTGGEMSGVILRATVRHTENIAHICKHKNVKNWKKKR